MNPKELGKKIAEAREARGMQQNELAKLVGVSASVMNRIEKGNFQRIRDVTINAINQVLEIGEKSKLSESEIEIMRKWSLLPEENRKVLQKLLDILSRPAQQQLQIDIIPFRAQPTPQQDQPEQGYRRIRLLGRAAAGAPIEGVRGSDEVDVPEEHLLGKHNYGAAYAVGDSMNREGIEDGCVVVFKETPQGGWGAGDMVIAQIIDDEGNPTGEHTIKRYWRRKSRTTLYPCSTNPDHTKQEYETRHVKVMGVVVIFESKKGTWHRIAKVSPKYLELEIH